MSVNEPHLVAVSLGDAGDKVLDVAESGADRRRCLPRSKPGFDLELALAGFLVGYELKVKL